MILGEWGITTGRLNLCTMNVIQITHKSSAFYRLKNRFSNMVIFPICPKDTDRHRLLMKKISRCYCLCDSKPTCKF